MTTKHTADRTAHSAAESALSANHNARRYAVMQPHRFSTPPFTLGGTRQAKQARESEHLQDRVPSYLRALPQSPRLYHPRRQAALRTLLYFSDDTILNTMASSYFDPQPTKAPAAAKMAEIADEDAFGTMGLLSPQVTRILDDLELEEKSSSDDENASLSGDSSPSDKDAKRDRKSHQSSSEQLRKSQTSPLPRAKKRVQIASPPTQNNRPGLAGHKHPHLARFHSLRSMLFSSQIEDNMQKCKEQQAQEEAGSKWKAEHDLRRGLSRPKTPEKEQKEGLVKKLKGGLRRMTSKEVPTLGKIKEQGDNESTASSDEDEEPQGRGSDDDIDHSDIEDLVRWVSRRDPPSDGENRRTMQKAEEATKEDSGHESLGHSDVDDLVRWVSRREEASSDQPQTRAAPTSTIEKEEIVHDGYSEASTESDSENDHYREASVKEDDVDDLMRWISHKEGPHAGPVRAKREGDKADPECVSETHDEDTAELVRWVTRKDDTSGESDVPDEETLPVINEPTKTSNWKPNEGSNLKTEVPQTESRGSLTHNDVDDLVRWVSRKNPDEPKEVPEEDETKTGARPSLSPEDVDELVKWVSRKDGEQGINASNQ